MEDGSLTRMLRRWGSEDSDTKALSTYKPHPNQYGALRRSFLAGSMLISSAVCAYLSRAEWGSSFVLDLLTYP